MGQKKGNLVFDRDFVNRLRRLKSLDEGERSEFIETLVRIIENEGRAPEQVAQALFDSAVSIDAEASQREEVARQNTARFRENKMWQVMARIGVARNPVEDSINATTDLVLRDDILQVFGILEKISQESENYGYYAALKAEFTALCNDPSSQRNHSFVRGYGEALETQPLQLSDIDARLIKRHMHDRAFSDDQALG